MATTQPVPYYVEQGGATVHIGASGHLQLTSGRVTFPGSLGNGYIDLGPYIFSARQLASAETLTTASGSIVNPDGAAAVTLVSTADQAAYLNVASAVVAGIKLPPIIMPTDFSTAGGITIGLIGEAAGSATAADAAQGFDIRCWAGIGDTEMGTTHPNFTSNGASDGPQSITLASGDVSTGLLNITLVPSAHAGRALRLYGGRITYTKRTS